MYIILSIKDKLQMSNVHVSSFSSEHIFLIVDFYADSYASNCFL